jgi:hypothetical protein
MFHLLKGEKIRKGKGSKVNSTYLVIRILFTLISRTKITKYLVSSSIGKSALKVVVALAVVVAAADGRALRAAIGADQL